MLPLWILLWAAVLGTTFGVLYDFHYFTLRANADGIQDGRRYIFYIAFINYFAFNFLCAFTPTFAGLLVGRFLTGTFASAALSNVPGVLADLWEPVDRGNAGVLFAIMTIAGPA